ncbi:aminoacyl-tRNA hydrolase [Helicobacter baculiformis]|uniref:Peptidyl-tRNA hydrolase n=1 Tax=Helicobacter baculiformis TaxID=427351 RepID=A0ABV7ZGZ8_9HELI|nr:aminoacyl-tRNA hydrolase [Helicobacter baculiformis]
MRLILGLGNPTPLYAHTRHNVGFDVLDLLADKFGVSFKRASNHHYAFIAQYSCYLLKPNTYMNTSGEALSAFLRYHHVRTLVVVHDDLDLPLGALRFKQKGGDGGHNGLKSIQAHYSHAFYKVKIGIGKGTDTHAHVLGHFESHEEPLKREVFEHTLEALCFYLMHDDFTRMQARFTRNPHKSSPCDFGSL